MLQSSLMLYCKNVLKAYLPDCGKSKMILSCDSCAEALIFRSAVKTNQIARCSTTEKPKKNRPGEIFK